MRWPSPIAATAWPSTSDARRRLRRSPPAAPPGPSACARTGVERGGWCGARGSNADRPSAHLSVLPRASGASILAVAYSRVDEGIGDVGGEDHEHQEDSDDAHVRLDLRVVPQLERTQGKLPHSWEAEQLLHNHRAAQDATKLSTPQGDERDDGVPQRVAVHDGPLRQPLGAGGTDVVLPE